MSVEVYSFVDFSYVAVHVFPVDMAMNAERGLPECMQIYFYQIVQIHALLSNNHFVWLVYNMHSVFIPVFRFADGHSFI